MTEEKKISLSKLAADIAQALGAPWTVRPPREGYEDENHPTRVLVNGAGAQIWVRADEYDIRGRASFSGSLNIGKNGQYETVYENGNRVSVPDITVALSRGPEAMAKEINRRLLPEYLRVLALAQAQVVRENERRAKKRAALSKLAGIAGTKMDFEKEPDRDRLYLPGSRSGHLDVHYDGDVQFERITVTQAEAEHILRYLYRDKNAVSE
jgi:hypothetical protein